MVQIIYEDNHIIVAVKPQNMPSQGDSSKDADMLSELKAYIKEKYAKPGAVYLGLVHRLDRPTGGVMVFARTSKAAARLSTQIKSGEFQKEYRCIVSAPLKTADTLEDWLLKDEKTNISRVVPEGTEGAKRCVLHYETLAQSGKLSLLNIKLETGRSHQIRVQLSNTGAPIAGDVKYGGAKNPKLCLWAHSLTFTHPTTKERLTFTAPLPDEKPWNSFTL